MRVMTLLETVYSLVVKLTHPEQAEKKEIKVLSQNRKAPVLYFGDERKQIM